MKKIITLCTATVMAVSSFAIPALPIWRSYRQADGTFLRVKTVGDEHFNYALTEDGIPVLAHDGSYYYACIDGDRLVASTILAHAKELRKDHEELNAAAIDRVNRLEGQVREQTMAAAPRKVTVRQGKKKGLVILVQFSDKNFTLPENVLTLGSGETDINTLYDHMLNQQGYTDMKSGAIGSVHDYFYDQSNGKLDLSFDVIGPVTLDHPYKYYGERTTRDNDAKAPQMISDACNAIKGKVNFADYDWNGDKEVEQVYVVYAGEGEATGGDENTVWPHKFSLVDAGLRTLNFDGITVNTYACSNEVIRANINGKERLFYMGIGTICHEFSHCLGLPDFYDTSNGGNLGTGAFDLMCSGSYNGGPESIKNVYGGTGIGTVPAGYTAYEKSFMEWTTPVILGEQALAVRGMKGISEDGNVYMLSNPSNANEYFLFENRSANRWDKELPGHGLLVLHVDYDANAWKYNTVNSAQHQAHPRVTIVPADDNLTNNTQDNDLYPIDINNSLTGSSMPSLSFYNGKATDSQVGVRDIRLADDGTISFDYSPLSSSTGIATAVRDQAAPFRVYTLSGVQTDKDILQGEQRQILIIRDAEGKSKKIVR